MSEKPDVQPVQNFVEHFGPTHHDYADCYKVDTLPSGTRLSFGRMRQDGSGIADVHTTVMLLNPVGQEFLQNLARIFAQPRH